MSKIIKILNLVLKIIILSKILIFKIVKTSNKELVRNSDNKTIKILKNLIIKLKNINSKILKCINIKTMTKFKFLIFNTKNNLKYLK